MAGRGDIAIHFTGDTTGLDQAMMRTEERMKKMSGGGARSFAQLGFAAQDFASVLSMGGPNALGRALLGTTNNIQVLGTAFGPLGRAITSVAGALATFLIPALLKSSSGMEELGKAADKTLEKLDKLASKESGSFSFVRSLEKLSSPNAAREAIADNEDQFELLTRDFERRRDVFQKLVLDAFGRGALTPHDPTKKLFDTKTGLLGQDVNVAGDPELAKRVREMQEKLEELQDTRERLLRRRSALADREDELEREDTVNLIARLDEEALKKQEKNTERRKQLFMETATPAERLTETLKELHDEFDRGVITEDLFNRGTDRAFAGFKSASANDRQVALPEALQRGSSGAISAIVKAQSEASNPQKEALRLARDQVRYAKQAVELLQDQRDRQPVVVAGKEID